MKRKHAATSRRQPIDPKLLYPLPVFCEHAGIGRNTITAAKRHGLELPIVEVGRCKFVQGEPGIAYLLELARLGVRTTVGETFASETVKG